MSDWTAGYVTDVGYTYGYYQELKPSHARLAFLRAGFACPSMTTACELGFGQGISINLNAAASGATWWGTDFNPSQAALAKEMSAASGADVHLFDQSFEEFAARTDLPEFDFIGLHGIWSWISDANRHIIVDFLRKRLKVGGVLYVSYNTLPGWAAFAPIRHLMQEHAEVIGAEGSGVIHRVNDAVMFADKMLATNPVYARTNPSIAQRVAKLKDKNRRYIAHEYFNGNWDPMHFATMARWLEPAKLQFACSATYLDSFDSLNLTAEQQAFLKEVPDRMFRETVRDFMVNQQFRRDYWVKGSRTLTALDSTEQIRKLPVMLTAAPESISLKLSGTAGEVTLNEGVYQPIIEMLADHQVRTVAQVEAQVRKKNISPGQVSQALTVLAGAGHLTVAQDEQAATKARKACDRLNQHLMSKARSSGDISYLASPATGGGASVGRFEQLFLRALGQGKKTSAELAQATWEIIGPQNQRLQKDGKALETNEDNVAELQRLAESFLVKRLPVMKALQIAG